MSRHCTCVRCKAEDFVRSVYPNMDDRRVLAVATDIVKALRSSVEQSRAAIGKTKSEQRSDSVRERRRAGTSQ